MQIRMIDAGVNNFDFAGVRQIDAGLLGAAVRLIRLMETPAELKMLAPLVIKEIIFRLLISGQGARLSHLIAASGDTLRISEAIGHLHQHFDEPLRIENIARTWDERLRLSSSF